MAGFYSVEIAEVDMSNETLALSKAYIYGLTWDGSLLLQGQLTERMVWNMRLNEKRNRHQRRQTHEKYLLTAAAGFDLLYQSSTLANDQLMDKILRTWLGYVANTKKFKKISTRHFQDGVHFVLFKWVDPSGETRMRTVVMTHPCHLSEANLQQVAYVFMNNEALKYPRTLPPAFLERQEKRGK